MPLTDELNWVAMFSGALTKPTFSVELPSAKPPDQQPILLPGGASSPACARSPICPLLTSYVIAVVSGLAMYGLKGYDCTAEGTAYIVRKREYLHRLRRRGNRVNDRLSLSRAEI